MQADQSKVLKPIYGPVHTGISGINRADRRAKAKVILREARKEHKALLMNISPMPKSLP